MTFPRLSLILKLVSLAVLTTQTAIPFLGQEAPSQSSTVLKVTTRLVLVDAIVTDKSGRHLTDLKPRDFQVREDGVPQKVRYVELHRPEQAAEAATRAPLSPGTFTNVPLVSVRETPTVVLLDFLNTPWESKTVAWQKVLDFVATAPAGRWLAIYVLDNDTHLKLICDFTNDAAKLRAAVSGKSSGLNRYVDTHVPQVGKIPVVATLNAFRELTRSLAGIPGRKDVVWVSAGFPISFDPTLGLNFEQLERTTALIADAQIAIYPVDARGLIAMEGNAEPGPSGLVVGPRYAGALTGAFKAIHDPQEMMRDIAEQTGGKAYYSRNDVNVAIGDAIADGSVYYTIGYYPENRTWDGKYRRVEVTVKRRGAEVRSHKGYYAMNPDATGPGHDAQAADQEFLNALEPGAPAVSALPVSVHFTQSALGNIDIHYVVDGNALTFVPPLVIEKKDVKPGDLRRGDFEFFAAVYDQSGNRVTHTAIRLNGALKPDAVENIRKNGLPFDQHVTVSPGAYISKLGVRDNATGLIGTVNAELEVPANDTSVAAIQPEAALPAPGPPPATVGSEPDARPTPISEYCHKLVPAGDSAGYLSDACEFALSVEHQLPDFICQQITTRREPGIAANGNRSSTQEVTTEVTFRQGHEFYSDIKLDGKPASGTLLELPGLSGTGEFGIVIHNIFDPRSAAHFSAPKRGSLNSRKTVAFDYEIAAENSQWVLNLAGSPRRRIPYHGTLWIDEATSRVIRVQEQSELDATFPIRRITVDINYADIKLGDRGPFTLPVRARAVACGGRWSADPSGINGQWCYWNTTAFRACRKFSTDTRIMSIQPVEKH